MVRFNFDKSKKDLNRYQGQLLNKHVAPKTQKQRTRVWAAWLEFAQGMEFDPETTWMELLRGSREAESRCQSFMKAYAQGSVRTVTVLGEEEKREVNTIRTGTTLEDVWQALVSSADTMVMESIRREKPPTEAGYWSLTYHSQHKGSVDKPTYKIARWLSELAIELGLNLGQTFTKREATTEDVILILTTLWERAVDISCSPEHRLAFHNVVLLSTLGGWRSASLIDIDYEDVEFGWVRHECSPGRYRYVPTAKIMIYHVKQPNVIRRDQKDRVGVWITQVPHRIICLPTFLLSQAIADNAFENNYTNVDQILERKFDSTVPYIRAHWKEEMLQKKIVSIPYGTYKRIWDRTLTVMGAQDQLRPYSMRVGSGGRLNGSLAPALRNFILSNSTEVFERSYIPVNLSIRLQEIAFPTMVDETQNVIARANQAFLRRDDGAPIYVPQQVIDGWEGRNDIKKLRAEYKLLKADSSKAKQASQYLGKIQSIRKTLERQFLKELREDYFVAANTLREKGESTDHLEDSCRIDPHKRNHAASNKMALRIGQYLLGPRPHPRLGHLLVDYMQKRLVVEHEGPSQRSRCLLPRCNRDFSSRSNLTQHVDKYHEHDFEQAFFCAECQRLEAKNVRVEGRQAWSSHAMRHHGQAHTPLVTERSACCFLCMKLFTEGGLNSHLALVHVKSGQFEKPFSCPACLDDDKKVMIDGADSWRVHTAEVHAVKQSMNAGRKEAPSRSKRKRGEEQSAFPTKRRSLQCRDYELDKIGGDSSTRDLSPDVHKGEEFWVTGRDEDYL